jgi:hypothetical protein
MTNEVWPDTVDFAMNFVEIVFLVLKWKRSSNSRDRQLIEMPRGSIFDERRVVPIGASVLDKLSHYPHM